MPESKHPVFFVVYVSGAILFLLLMELSRVHDLVMLDRPDTESFITQVDFHCTYKIIVTVRVIIKNAWETGIVLLLMN